jgi:hypothetical protein
MRKCRFCHDEIEDAATVCPHCGKDLIPGRRTVYPPEPAPIPETEPVAIARVSVVDINMPFASMVGFMVKWALASIPAFLILAVFAAGLFLLLTILGIATK